MKVVLLDNIRGIGRVGDVKDVSDGYARNFLLPNRKAKTASEGAVRDAASLKAKKLEAATMAHDQAQELAARLKGVVVEMHAKANPKGKLFAGIEAAHVAEAASPLAGARIAPGQVGLDGHIKTVGDHPVALHLSDDVTADIIVRVIAE